VIAWQSKINVFVGSKVTLIPAPDPTEGEVKPVMFDDPFLNLFPIKNLSTKYEHQKSF